MNFPNTPESPMAVANMPAMLGCRLLFKQQPVIHHARILEELQKSYPAVENTGNMLFTFPNLPVELSDITVHAQCAIMPVTRLGLIPEQVLQQNWHWSAAAEVTAGCRHELLINDLMTRQLPYKARHELFTNFLKAVIIVTQPDVVYSLPAEKMLPPNQIFEQQGLLDTVVNVRLFNISNSTNKEMLMDTIGLHTFGLPDFEIRFANENPSSVATLLWNLAYYAFDKGDVIQDGDTIEGPTPGSKLTCQRSMSLVAPDREVISFS
ncbi:DUF4261 domain-containing protein [Chitinophaga pinensis]|uniref:DUF4261 domain-containing protein n=1 Tax=Chitinophaga pinensis TaxID=79329 RepID=A0A5C6LQX0_9BACT|nr:DUF4261 domain-containing protein [Chitinophaga pinensis]TWV96185.1 DUF4261 domain-containing protein [Chitinophaga pinensis]